MSGPMQGSTEAEGQAGKTPKLRWRNRTLSPAPPRAVTGGPSAHGPGVTPVTVRGPCPSPYRLRQGSGSRYRMPKRSIWGLDKAYDGMFRGGTGSWKREDPKTGYWLALSV